MPLLNNTTLLMNRYGEKLITGTINDTELQELLSRENFKQSPGYVDPTALVTEKNHSALDALKDFILTIAPQLEQDILHTLTARLIELAPKGGENTFLRNSTLEKCFLAYEMAHSPEAAEQHFHAPRMTKEFSEEDRQATSIWRTRILSPLSEFFINPDERFKASHFGKNKNTLFESSPNPPEMNESLKGFTTHYLLAQWCEALTGRNIMADGKFRAEKKYNIGQKLLEILTNNPDIIKNDLLLKFQSLLEENNLTKEEFFSGQTKIYLSPELVTLLTPTATEETIPFSP